jgi:hypothetical protein
MGVAKTRSWLPIVAGVAILLVFLAAAGMFAAVSFFRDRVDIDRSHTAETVSDEFDRVRALFPEPAPLLEFDGDHARVTEHAQRRESTASLSTLHAMAWDPRDHELVRFSVPFWLLRLKSGPIEIGSYVSGLDRQTARITVADIERFGPGVVLDYADPRGARVLVWTQ